MVLILLFFFSILGMILSISSNNWFMVWLGFELNMFCILPFLKENNNKGMELYYFIIQVIGTLLLLWGCMFNFNSIMGLFGLFMKIGFFPFFWWVPSIFLKLKWVAIFMIGVIQKIPSIFLIRWFDMKDEQILFISMMILFISMLGMYNSIKSMKLLFGWSSVMNTSLAIQLVMIGKVFFFFFFFSCYFFISLFCCYCFFQFDLKEFNNNKSDIFWLFKGMVGLFFFTGMPQIGFMYKIILFSGFSNMKLEWLILLFLIINLFFQMVVYMKIFNYYFFSFKLNLMWNIKYSLILIFFYFVLIPMIFFLKC